MIINEKTQEEHFVYKIAPEAVNIIKNHEGFYPKRYLCPGKKWTIGYGHQIKPGEVFNSPITKAEAENILEKEINENYDEMLGLLKGIKLNKNQLGALTSFYFNVGGSVFAKSTLLRYLKAGDFAKAADEFTKFVYAAGEPLRGLFERRLDERNLFLTPIS